MNSRLLLSIASALDVLMLLAGAILRWWFHGADDVVSIDFGLWDTHGCTARGCATLGYTHEWMNDGWRSPDAVAMLERMVLFARITLFAAIGTSAALLASLLRPLNAWIRRIAVLLAAVVVVGAIVVLTHRPTFEAPNMQYFAMRTGLGGGITIAGAVLAGLAAALLPRRADA
jgi:hypothetical protein